MNLLPVILIISLLNSCIELEISAPSFPSIMHYFDISASTVGLTITLNLVGFCLAALVYGPLSDRLGRRKTMLIGNAVLLVGAIGCTFAPTIEWLLCARFIQGLGAATSAVVVSAIVADSYTTERAAILYGIMNAVFTTVMALSPLLGGVINNYIGWRGNYGVVMMVCLIAWLLQYGKLPETISKKKPQRLKLITNEYRTILSNSSFISMAIVPSILYAAYLAYISIAPFIYTNEFNVAQSTYVLHQAVVIAVFAICSAFSGKALQVFGQKKILLISCMALTIGSVQMFLVHQAALVTLAMSIFVIGFAWLYPIVFAHSMEVFPELKGSASSLIMSLRYMICAIVTAGASFLYKGHVSNLATILVLIAMIVVSLVHSVLKRNVFTYQHSGTAHI